MSSLSSLQQKIDRMIGAIDERLTTALDPAPGIDLSLFSEQEQAEFTTVFNAIQPRISTINGRLDLSQLTNQELDLLETWYTRAEQRAAQ